MMIVINYFDWFGTPEELEKLNEAWKKICEEADEIKSTKLYTSHQARYHYAWIIKTDSYDAVLEANSKMPPRDRNKLTHAVLEVFTEM
jgi:hypothetical protein